MKGHLTASMIDQLRRGNLPAADVLPAFRHLAECDDCALLAREAGIAGRAAKTMHQALFVDEEHPELESELFAYANGTLASERRAALEEHLTHCRICREDVADAVRTRQEMRRPSRSQQWWLAAAAAAALAIFGALLWTRANRIAPEKPVAMQVSVRSLAVLPLQNSGSVKADDFLAVALADSLATQLGDIPALQVRPMSAVLASHNVASLAVDSLIEGRFSVTGNLVQITLWLTDSRTGRNLWVGSVTGPRDNLLSVVENVSAQTLIALNEKLGVQRSGHASAPRSGNPLAFEEYLKARAVNQSLIPAMHAEEMAHLQRAIAFDPQFAAAYADLSIAISLGQLRGLNDAAQAEHLAREAVRLDPNLPTAHLALARALFATDFRRSMLEIVAALRLNVRDSQTMSILVSFFVLSGDEARSECLIRHLPEIEPSSQEWLVRGYWYLNLLDAPAAKRAAADALATKSHEILGCHIAASACILEGKLDEADRYAARAEAIMPGGYIASSIAAQIAAARGDRTTALRKLQAFSAEASRNRWAALSQVIVYGKLGDRAQTVYWAKRTRQLGSHSWWTMKHHPWLQGVQDDPEFQSTLEQMRADLDYTRGAMLNVYESICGAELRRNGR
jgi:TolB-like protein